MSSSVQPPAPDPPQHGPDRSTERSTRPRRPDGDEPRRGRRDLRRASWCGQRPRHHRRLRRHRGRDRQLPDPLPGERRLAAQADPGIHGSIFRFEGQVTVFEPYDGPCYRCLIPEPPPAELAPSCAEAGVLGVLPGIIGSIQAVEAIKLLIGIGDPLIGRLFAFDTLEESFRTFKVGGTRPARPAGRTPERSSSPSTTISACRTRTERNRRARRCPCAQWDPLDGPRTVPDRTSVTVGMARIRRERCDDLV